MNDPPKNTWMIDALQRGDFAAVRQRVMDEPSFLDERDFIGDTPIQAAVSFGDPGLVEFLLEQSADPDAAGDDGYSCLLTAVESNAAESLRVLEILLNAGAGIHERGVNGWTPLHMAAALGESEKAKLLIQRGAGVDCRTTIDGCETPLMEAAFAGHPEMVALLLQHGADPTMRDETIGRNSLEIAQHAALGADANTYQMLKQEAGQFDPTGLPDDLDLAPEQRAELIEEVRNVDLAETYRDNANRLAASGDHAGVIRILQDHMRR